MAMLSDAKVSLNSDKNFIVFFLLHSTFQLTIYYTYKYQSYIHYSF